MVALWAKNLALGRTGESVQNSSQQKNHSSTTMPGDVTVPSFGPKMVCTRCGTIGADVRPNWKERSK
jgi:hypothetical protein